SRVAAKEPCDERPDHAVPPRRRLRTALHVAAPRGSGDGLPLRLGGACRPGCTERARSQQLLLCTCGGRTRVHLSVRATHLPLALRCPVPRPQAREDAPCSLPSFL